jgi:peroxiredoxin
MVAGALALGGLVANHWAEQVLAPGWVDRHIKEIVGNRPLGGRSAAIGQAAPAMTMKTIDGETVRLEDLAGKVVVLNFWATWCPPCVAEIPDLARLAKEVNQEGGVVIGISDEDVDTIRSFVASRDMPYAIVSGSDWPAPFESIRAIPVTYFLDGAGTIREELVGGSSYEVFRRAFDAAKAPLSPLADPAPGVLP